jgi:hypothetical protein
MRHLFAAAPLLIAFSAIAGDFIDGPYRYEVDLAEAHKQYEMTAADRRWADSLLRNLHQKGRVTYLTRTDLPLSRDGERIDGAVYRPLGRFSDWYYVSDGDVVIAASEHAILSPGCGGFSMHAPKSRNFIVALYFGTPCVPIRRHSEIGVGKIWYYAEKSFDRLAIDQ